MKFSSKGKTLLALKGLAEARIPEVLIVEGADWQRDPAGALKNVNSRLGFKNPLIVRSSCAAEDGFHASAAGKYLSIAHLDSAPKVQEAIGQVFESYQMPMDREHVFIQPMVADVVCSGVAFTKDPSTGSGYFVVNYDQSGGTDGVTSGRGRETRSLVIFKNSPVEPPKPFAKLLTLLRKLEQLFETDSLDVEFAFDRKGELHLLQVRPLVAQSTTAAESALVEQRLSEIQRKVGHWLERKPFLLGSRTIFGVMPDWNPAEIIGVRPRPLALSLYKELVTDSTWAYQRDNYGYRNLRSQPLIQSFFGCPFIDVRVDFNSFVPADVEEPLAEKLVEYYLDRLTENPRLHDKVEFDIIFSCYHFNLEQEISKLKNYGFTGDEVGRLVESLRNLTVRIVDKHTGLWKKDLERVERLEVRHRELMSSPMDSVEKIYWLLEDCKRYGTLPFAGLARAGFIAVQMLKSLVACGMLNQTEYGEFMNSLNTVSTRMSHDYASLSRETFLSIYGHLRPGTYDILSARYDEAPDSYFSWEKSEKEAANYSFKLSLEQYKRIEKELQAHKLDLDVLSLFEFLKSAIEGREYSKFLFTRNVSDSISLVKRLGQDLDISQEDLSYMDIHTLERLYSSSEDPKRMILESIARGKEDYSVTRSLILPSLIFKPEDVFCFHMLDTEPNYITQMSVESDLVFLNSHGQSLEGKIVLIENADPGFDWIFTKGIKGFITMYGGANSHMAIRAGEMKIPAVVGAGEVNFTKWLKAKRLLIDCCNRQVKVLQ